MKLTALLFAIAFAATACGSPTSSATPGATSQPTSGPTATPLPTELTLLTHDSFAIDDSVMAEFESANNAHVNVLRAGDAGAMVNQAILTKDNPVADALFGVDNTFLSRALDAGIFQPYGATGLEQVPAALKLDARDRVTPVDYGDVCIVFDKSAYSDSNPAPQSIADLTKPAYKDQLVVEDPATSSPGLAFVLATIARFGETGSYTWLDYWRDLKANGVTIVSGWEEAYDSTFSGGSGTGDKPLVVSYATDPAAEVFFAASPQPTVSPVGVLTDGCFRQVEFAGVLTGAKQPELAQKLVDFMLSADFQADIPLNMFVFPAVPSAPVPDVFKTFAVQVPNPLSVPVDTIAANRDQWLSQWSAAFP